MSIEQLIVEGTIKADDLVVMLAQFSTDRPTTDLCTIIRPADVFTDDDVLLSGRDRCASCAVNTNSKK